MTRFWEIGWNIDIWSFCHHMQCIFDPKRAKTAQTRFFSGTGLFHNKSKLQFKYAKLGRSYGLCHFRRIRKPQLYAKNKKILWTDFEISAKWTDGRTNGRRLNHKSQPRCGGPKRKPIFTSRSGNFKHEKVSWRKS